MRITLLCCLFFLSSCVSGSINPSWQKPITTETPTATENRTIATPSYGTGKVKVEIFADFQCPACIMFSENIWPIFEEYAASGKLTIEYRQFPLTMHKNALGDALAALCSAEQWKYMDYKKWLYALEKNKSGQNVSDDERIGIAKNLGLDEAKFSTCLSSRAYEKQIQADMALGESKWLEGTPTIYLDGIKIDMSLFRNREGFKTFLDNRTK